MILPVGKNQPRTPPSVRISDSGLRALTDTEVECLNTLAAAWNLFVELPEISPRDRVGFMDAITAAQYILFARPALEKEWKAKDASKD